LAFPRESPLGRRGEQIAFADEYHAISSDRETTEV
jgi:hypothetical protein